MEDKIKLIELIKDDTIKIRGKTKEEIVLQLEEHNISIKTFMKLKITDLSDARLNALYKMRNDMYEDLCNQQGSTSFIKQEKII